MEYTFVAFHNRSKLKFKHGIDEHRINDRMKKKALTILTYMNTIMKNNKNKIK